MKTKWSPVNNVFLYITMIAIVLMGILTTLDVIFRWFVDKPIGPVFSFCETLMAVMVFGSLAPTQQDGAHINVTLFTRNMKEKWQTILAVFSLIICLIFFALMFSQTLLDGIWAYQTNTFRYGDYYRFPTWWARLFVPIGILVMMGQLVFEIKANCSKLFFTIKPTH